MKPAPHWTPHYIACRVATLFYQATHPNSPWLTPSANRLLARNLKLTDIGLEYGCGRSTSWIAQRVDHLTSVEHDPVWARKVQSNLAKKEIKNVNLQLHESLPEYIEVARVFSDGSLDFCLVDGIARARCVFESLSKLRPGGLLIVDNANKYLPCRSRSPGTRSMEEGAVSEDWDKLATELENWKTIWTTSGVTDTAFFFKPE